MNETNNDQSVDLRNHDIQLTVKYLRHLMRELHLPLDELLAILRIPRKERSTYRRIFAKQLQKPAREPKA